MYDMGVDPNGGGGMGGGFDFQQGGGFPFGGFHQFQQGGFSGFGQQSRGFGGGHFHTSDDY
jgi:hypothetical protein